MDAKEEEGEDPVASSPPLGAPLSPSSCSLLALEPRPYHPLWALVDLEA